MVYNRLISGHTLCWLCGEVILRPGLLCPGCRKDLPYVTTPQCRGCGKSLLSEALGNKPVYCGSCQRRSPPYDDLRVLFWYQPPVDRLIQKLKFDQKLLYARLLGELWAGKLEADGFKPANKQVLVPIPLHRWRLWGRGYNQSLELIRPAARHFHMTIDGRLLKRVRKTAAQSDLPLAKRENNVRHAFSARLEHCEGKDIVLVDDVLTSGATINAATRTLYQAGANSVSVLVLARTREN